MNPRFHHRQRGQALTEIAIASAAVFVPMLLLTMYLGKLNDAKYTAQQAARYAAWERTVWRESAGGVPGGVSVAVKDRARVDREVLARLFQDPNAQGLPTNITAQPSNANVNPMLRETDGTSLVELQRASGNAQQGIRPRLSTYQDAGTSSSTVGSTLNAIASLSGGPRLNTQGFARADYSVRTNPYLPNIFRNNEFGPVPLNTREIVLTDGWGAGGSAHEEWVVEPLVLGDLLDNGVVRTITQVGFSLVGMDAPEFGKVAPDVVPTDRRR